MSDLEFFSEETNYPMVVLHVDAGSTPALVRNGETVPLAAVDVVGTYSFSVNTQVAKYFDGPKVGDYLVCTSGMTIGKNEFFVRNVKHDAGGLHVVEPYEFTFFDDPITVAGERPRARLNKLGPRKLDEVRAAEATGETRRNV